MRLYLQSLRRLRPTGRGEGGRRSLMLDNQRSIIETLTVKIDDEKNTENRREIIVVVLALMWELFNVKSCKLFY